MNTIIINPPFSDPLVPPPSVAVLSELFSKFSDIKAYDMNLLLFNKVLSKQGNTINQFKMSISNTITAEEYLTKLRQLTTIISKSNHYRHKNNNGNLVTFERCSLKPNSIWPIKELKNCYYTLLADEIGSVYEAEIFNCIPDILNADIVLITSTFDSQILTSIMLANVLRKANFTGPIIWGGVAVSWLGDYLCNIDLVECIDAIFKGDLPNDTEYIGELATDWIRSKNTSLRGIPKVIGIDNKAYNCPSILSLDGSGFKHLPLEDYWSAEPLMCILLSRGCYYGNCSFCSYGYTKYSKYHVNSTKKAIERLEAFVQNTGCDNLCLESDCFTVGQMESYSEEIIRRGLKLRWHTSLRFEKALTQAVLEKLFRSGCRRIYFGFESGSKRILSLMNKGINLSIVNRVLNDCKKLGIAVEIGVIYGFPGETKDDAQMTYDFLSEHSWLIHRCDCSLYRCVTDSIVANLPNLYDITITGRDANYYTYLWQDNANHSYDHRMTYYEKTAKLFKHNHVFEISEDIHIVNKFGVAKIWSFLDSISLE